MNTPLASRSLVAVKPNGERIAVELAIGHPYELTPEEWAISVSMRGIRARLGDIHGIDAWQVIQLAYSFIGQLMEQFVEEGGRLYWPETDEPIELHELFSRDIGK